MSQADFFLKLDGVDGESTDEKHTNAIEIMSFNFGANNTGTSSIGTGAGSGKVNIHDFHFVKVFDKASSNLFQRVANGEHIPTATLICRKSTGTGGQQDYLTVKMTDVVISSYTCGGSSGGSPIPSESISLNFTKIEFDYKPQKRTARSVVRSRAVGIRRPTRRSKVSPSPGVDFGAGQGRAIRPAFAARSGRCPGSSSKALDACFCGSRGGASGDKHRVARR